MARFGLYFFLLFIASCGNPKASPEEENAEDFGQFSELFKEATTPYTLSDSALLNNKDTARIHNEEFLSVIPDSIASKVFSNKAKVRYTPVARFDGGKNGTYYLVKGTSGSKKGAFLIVADEEKSFKGFLPFLIPDNDNTTRQHTILEKNLSVSRNISRKLPAEPLAEGKDVFAYSAASGNFELVMVDPLDDKQPELINPIDTLARTHKLAGDYGRDKNTLVSIRDGRKPGLLTIFIHIARNDGACTGEIKGDAEIIEPTKAVYRQAGDPCVLNINFTKNGVTLEEQEGCGSKRGLECKFDGNYPRKKPAKEKNTTKKEVKS